jgi:hypothetical protein
MKWNLLRLFESVNGISVPDESDIKQLNEIDWSGDFKDVIKKCIPPNDLKKYLNDVLKNNDLPYKDRQKFSLDMPHVHGKRLQTDDLGEVDIEQFIQNITDYPPKIISDNVKMQKSETEDSISINIGIPALRGLVYDMDEKQFYFVNTCPGAGSCATICYAKKGSYVMFPDVFVKQTRVLNLLLNDPSKFQSMLELELEKVCQKNKDYEIVFRWNDAGDFFTKRYYEIARDITKNLTKKGYNFKSYGYTKMGDVVNADKPENFVINFSDDANKRETKKVDTSNVKKSVIVPKELFFDLMLKDKTGRNYVKDENGKVQFASRLGLEELKSRLAKEYGVDKKSIISYDQMLGIPEGSEPKYNVIVMPAGDGDLPAQRKDVKITFLLFH